MSTETTEDEFIEEYQGLVRSIAAKVAAQYDLDVDLEDLLADGFKGLVEARTRFDPSKGVQFNTFAYYRIRGAMLDGVRRQAFIPRRAYAKLRAAEAALDIGEWTGQVRAAHAGGMDAATAAQTIQDTLARISASFVVTALGQDEAEQERRSPETALLKAEDKSRLHKALETLPERERALIAGHYLEGRRFDHVAQELGISKSWASRLHTKALDRLREVLSADE